MRIANEILMHFRSTKKYAGDVSLDEPMEQDGDGSSLSLMDVLSSHDRGLEQVDNSDQGQLLFRALQTLEPREREIIRLRYGLTGQAVAEANDFALARLQGLQGAKQQLPLVAVVHLLQSAVVAGQDVHQGQGTAVPVLLHRLVKRDVTGVFFG